MKRIYCDFCGKEVSTEPRTSEHVPAKLSRWMKVIINAVIEKDIRYYGGISPEQYDACFECVTAIKETLKRLAIKKGLKVTTK